MVLIPGQEDALEKEMATHSSILAWRMPWMENPMDDESESEKAGLKLNIQKTRIMASGPSIRGK